MIGQISLDDDRLSIEATVTDSETGHMRLEASLVSGDLDVCVGWYLAILGSDPARWRELATKAAEIADALEQANGTSTEAPPSPACNGAGVGRRVPRIPPQEATPGKCVHCNSALVDGECPHAWHGEGAAPRGKHSVASDAARNGSGVGTGEPKCTACGDTGIKLECSPNARRYCTTCEKGAVLAEVEDDEDDRVARSLQRENDYWRSVGGWDYGPDGPDEDDDEVQP